MRRAVIAGVGLMGGSLGLALRSRGWRVVGLGRDAARLARARRRGAVDEATTDPARALPGADVLVLCAPVDRLAEQARRLRPFIDTKTLVMDVGSVKGAVVRALAPLFPRTGPFFIGSHPMTGSEKTGVENARPDLYRGAPCVITPAPGASAGAIARAEEFWRALGARVVRLAPEAHDRAVAVVSHLPHLIADALMLTAGRVGAAPLFRLAAGSFRDATRVAGADPALWRAIFAMNQKDLRGAVTVFNGELRRLSRGWPLPALRRARALNDRFRKDQP
jgi:prephenate dehydrogenase